MVAARYFAEQKVPHRGEPELTGGIACYVPYEAKDGGWVSLGALEPKFWQNWCNGVRRPDLIEKQFEHPDSEAGAEIAAVFRSEPATSGRRSPVSTTAASSRSSTSTKRSARSWCAHAGWSWSCTSRASAPVKQVGAPIKLSRTPADTTGAAPRAGRDTDDGAARDRQSTPAPARRPGAA